MFQRFPREIRNSPPAHYTVELNYLGQKNWKNSNLVFLKLGTTNGAYLL